MIRHLSAFLFAALLPLYGCLYTQAIDTSDPAVTARVKLELKSDPDLAVKYLDVVTNQGVVTLSGMVESYEQRETIVQRVNRIRGVKQVIANILVQE